MLDYGQTLQAARRNLRLTQLEVAKRTNISLATIQNLEAGKGNPSWHTLHKLFVALHLNLEIQSIAINWELLILLGCPLIQTTPTTPFIFPTRELLRSTLQSLFITKHFTSFSERENQALLSWLWAVKCHYPSLWKITHADTIKWFEKNKRHTSIKLRRLALSQMGYL